MSVPLLLLGFGFSFHNCAFVRAITAIFVGAVTKGALLLGRLLEQKRRLTLWANLEHRFIPINPIAIGIRTTTIKHFAALRLLNY